jgi:sec-independent protein translocase protein TatB
MFDMSWGEVMVIGAVALIVIGPKDLPKALRTVGNMVGKIRRMASEFQGQFNEALREAELDDVKRQLQGMNDTVSKGFNPVQTIRDEIKGAIEAPVEPASAGERPVTSAEEPPPMSLGLPEVPPVAEPGPSISTSVEPDLTPQPALEETPARIAGEKA